MAEPRSSLVETAIRLRRSRERVMRLIERGILDAKRQDGRWMVSDASIAELEQAERESSAAA